MKYRNLNLKNPEDALRALVGQATNKNTVPHGIKSVEPGEGLELLNFSGDTIFWDWDAANNYDVRISEARELVSQARVDLDLAELELGDAMARIEQTRTELAAADQRATAAKDLADTVATNLTALSGQVDGVSASATAAEQSALAVKTAADTAVSAAQSAKSTAETADSAAKAAAGLAESKGEVIYQASKPTGSRAAAQNLWIRTSDNKPHTWNGTTWVAVTDKAATDAAAAAAAAQSKADKAATDAQAAVTAAGNAQSTADGKSTITVSTTAGKPPWNGKSAGDMHYVITSSSIREWWRWNGTGWFNAPLDSQAIANLDVGKLTGIFADFNQYVKAGSVLADRVLIGIGNNLIPNGIGAQGPNVVPGQGMTWDAEKQGWAFDEMNAWRKLPETGAYPVTAGREYEFAVTVTTDSAGTDFAIRTEWLEETNSDAYMASNYDLWPKGIPAGKSEYQATLTPPTGAKAVRFSVVPTHRLGAQYKQWMTFSLREMEDGSLVANGAITGRHVEGKSVAGEVARFLTVEAMTGVFTTSLTANDSTLLGTTVAEALNLTGKLNGRDAIFDGTVDVEQLNVTGEMAGTIARFMDVQARRAIFTEGLTANESTLLGTTVAEAINAGTVASRMITGGLLQTSTAANRGVKIDSSGIRAWDSSGRQTVNINGTSNYLTGEFSTAPSGQRVKISNSGSIAAIDLYASRSTDDHIGMWYDSPDTNVLNAVGRVLAISGTSYTSDSPGLLMYPMRGTFGFQGRWQQETDATKFVQLTNSTGLKAGEWAQITVPYQKAFPTNNSLRLPVVSVERLYGADVIVNIVSESASSITLLVVNKSTSGTSGPIKVRAAVFNLNS